VANTSKSHKSRKTGAAKAKPRKSSGDSPSSAAIVPATPDPSSDVAKPEKGERDAPPAGIGTGAPEELPREKQAWYRPADSKARKHFEKIAIMRAAGRNDAEIAKKLKTTEASVRQYVYLAKKNGWVDDEGEPIDLEAELAINIDRKVVRNISASLDGQMTNWQTHEMTLAAAKGRGMFKSAVADGGNAPNVMSVVQIQIVNPSVGASDQMVVEENVGGVPAYIEGEVEDGLSGASHASSVSMVPSQGVSDGEQRVRSGGAE
jgi:hypothetical protein